MIMKGIGIPSGLQPSVAKLLPDYYFSKRKILLRFDDVLIKSMKEGFARLNTNPFQNHQEFSLINNIRITLIHFLLEDFHYEP
ncbi:TPA: hypothetical protein L4T36_003592 [Escherichia coli]|nr:hypothetical protein [Escherichia coli]QMM62059.1 hypothetical protein HVW99_10255 [Escherichia coli]QMM89717.1 hypothetical protein HVW93_10255 [Escherichia coli]HBV0428912.1 hypothetical protein [Escherichia coli]